MASSDSPSFSIPGLIRDSLGRLPKRTRAIVVVAGIIGIVGTGVVGASSQQPVRIATIAVIGVLFIVALGLVAHEVSPADDQIDELKSLIAGHWWQLIIGPTKAGISYVTVEVDGGISIEGESYSTDGYYHACWTSRTACAEQGRPVAVFYTWSGRQVMSPPRVLSGIGRFEFQAHDHGDGYFTTGDLAQLLFQDSSSVQLKRASKHDTLVMRTGDDYAKLEIAMAHQAAWRADLPKTAPVAGASAPPTG